MRLDHVWLIHRDGSQEAQQQARASAEALRSLGAHTVVAMAAAATDPYPGLLACEGAKADLAVVFGGDGTVLGAARHLAPLRIPILAFNVGGHLGFLAHDRAMLRANAPSAGAGVVSLWERLLQDRYAVERRMMLQATVERADESHLALNDLYLRACLENTSPTCELELEIDGEVVDHYRGDGLIMATPTGSTAYAMAAGGPILHPGLDAVLVSPICPMSLSSRPLVVPPRARLVVWALGDSRRRVKLWTDGAGASVFDPGDRCVVERAPCDARFVVLEQRPS